MNDESLCLLLREALSLEVGADPSNAICLELSLLLTFQIFKSSQFSSEDTISRLLSSNGPTESYCSFVSQGSVVVLACFVLEIMDVLSHGILV